MIRLRRTKRGEDWKETATGSVGERKKKGRFRDQS
jgi:hypothetical protein